MCNYSKIDLFFIFLVVWTSNYFRKQRIFLYDVTLFIEQSCDVVIKKEKIGGLVVEFIIFENICVEKKLITFICFLLWL